MSKLDSTSGPSLSANVCSIMADAFRNLDDRTIFAEDLKIIEQPTCESFAVQFNANAASSCVQVNHETVQNLLRGRAQTKDPSACLWMNLWGWSPENQSILEAVARHYELSPRLAHSMCPSTAPTPAQRTGPTSINANSSKPAANMPRPASSMADVFEAVWHFGSVDFGHRYICLGWNALFFLPHTPKSLYGSKPNAMRVWSTVLLCDDGTVVSIFEKPLAASSEMLLRARRNQINILKDLSNVYEAQRNALFRTAIRMAQVQHRSGSQTDMFEMASLLFYYLFDDWENLFSQVSGSEFSYRRQLELLREETIEHPNSKQIDRVHQLGRQLSSLRSICRSYQSLIEQLLRSQTSLGQPASRSMLALNDSSFDSDFIRLPLSSMVRFARLQNRIELCAMTELDDCVSEKDSLVQMVRRHVHSPG
jgi:hypothetical protein